MWRKKDEWEAKAMNLAGFGHCWLRNEEKEKYEKDR